MSLPESFLLSGLGAWSLPGRLDFLEERCKCCPCPMPSTLKYERAFFQTVCVIGYTIFPLVIAALLSAFHLHWIPRIPIYLVLLLWSFAAGVSILGGSGIVKNRVVLAVYPLFVYYMGLGTLCFIS